MIFAALPGFVQRPVMIRRFEARQAWAELEVRELPKIIRPGDVAIDVGGNVGVYTFALSKLAARVISFEPNPQLAARLRTLALANVEVKDVALSSSAGTATLTIPDWPEGHGFGSLRAEMGFGDTRLIKHEVAMRTLDSFAFDKLDFIKIDVEGFEEQVLDGGMRTIEARRPAILIELVDKFAPGVHARVAARLGALGYSGFFLLDGAWHAFAEFDLAKHHDRSRVIDNKDQPRGAWGYVNNFLFLPPGRTIGH